MMPPDKNHNSLVIFLVAGLLATINQKGFKVMAATEEIKQFSQENFIVRLQPKLSSHHNIHDENDIIPLLKIVSTQFSTISVPAFPSSGLRGHFALVPAAAAKFNLQQSLNATIIKPKPLKVLFLYLIGDDAATINDLTFADSIIRIATSANSIYPGTVEYIISVGFTEDEDIKGLRQKHLIAVRKKLNGLPNNTIKLGAEFDFSVCVLRPDIKSDLLKVFDQLNLAIFNYWPLEESFKEGSEKGLSRATKQFDNCKEKVKELHIEGMEVGFQSLWPDTDSNGLQNFSSLVSFWDGLNSWIGETNTKVLLWGAFNEVLINKYYQHAGWWRVTSKGDYADTGDYTFEDKRRAAANERSLKTGNGSNDTSPTATTNSDSFKTAMISVIAVVAVLFLFVVGAVVFMYKKVVKNRTQYQQDFSISKSDMDAFFLGIGESNKPEASEYQDQDEYLMFGSMVDAAYDFGIELKQNEFQIDWDSALGSGAFGSVYLGKVFKNSGSFAVAVKTLKKGYPSTRLKDFLTEIKVLMHLGQHENIVSLIGAYAKELEKGQIYLFIELCSLGSLESYLRKYSSLVSDAAAVTGTSGYDSNDPYTELVEEGSSAEIIRNESKKLLDSEQLIRWSCDIVNGMEFISSKNIVHADLATRNVLLTKDLTAKISDFGLSRRLYNYLNYVKSKQEPLPWKWMAPEALLYMKFSEKSDVWALGITLWEIYSLGCTPYPGLSYSTNFASNLIRGLRLEEPEYNADGMYTIMLRCWDNEPTQRPTFSRIKADLSRERENIISKYYQAHE